MPWMLPSLYAHRALYHLVMRGLYGRHYHDRYLAVAAEVSPRATVVEICAGDCYLYLNYLRQKSVAYVGLDLSPHFVRWAQAHGVSAREWDMWKDDVPPADVVIMQAGLYQFMPHARAVLVKMLAAARQKVIVAEPVRNIASSSNPALARLGRQLIRLSLSEQVDMGGRYERASLTRLFHSVEAFQRSFLIPGGKDMVGVFRGGVPVSGPRPRADQPRDVA
jgi:hypothetical protein